MTLTPSPGRNHIFPSADLAGPVAVIPEIILTPSALSKTAAVDRLPGIDGPCIQIPAGNPQQPHARVQPEEVAVILHDPLNDVARQSVPVGKREDLAVFDTAQTALCCRPDRAVLIAA